MSTEIRLEGKEGKENMIAAIDKNTLNKVLTVCFLPKKKGAYNISGRLTLNAHTRLSEVVEFYNTLNKCFRAALKIKSVEEGELVFNVTLEDSRSLEQFDAKTYKATAFWGEDGFQLDCVHSEHETNWGTPSIFFNREEDWTKIIAEDLFRPTLDGISNIEKFPYTLYTTEKRTKVYDKVGTYETIRKTWIDVSAFCNESDLFTFIKSLEQEVKGLSSHSKKENGFMSGVEFKVSKNLCNTSFSCTTSSFLEEGNTLGDLTFSSSYNGSERKEYVVFHKKPLMYMAKLIDDGAVY